MKNQATEEGRETGYSKTEEKSSSDQIELARARGRNQARHSLLFRGIHSIDPNRRIVVQEASEQEIALHQEANALSELEEQGQHKRHEAEELAYLQAVEEAGGWEAFLEQRNAFHEEREQERQRLWQAQIALYGA